ncbi:MAG TPA: hypothetical protein VFE48_22370 [Methylomirabilota bacterium]|nr:hypothetical protein [Methylomirabilota bacterium]
MKKIASVWLNGQDVRKDNEGLGRALTGPSIGSVIMKMAATELVCKNGHETTLGDAPDSGRCATCKAKLAVKGQHAKDEDAEEDDEMDEDERKARGIARKDEDADEDDDDAKRARKTGGRLDGRPIYSERRKSRISIDSPRQPMVRD